MTLSAETIPDGPAPMSSVPTRPRADFLLHEWFAIPRTCNLFAFAAPPDCGGALHPRRHVLYHATMRAGREPAEDVKKRVVAACKEAGLTVQSACMRLQIETIFQVR